MVDVRIDVRTLVSRFIAAAWKGTHLIVMVSNVMVNSSSHT